MTYTLTETGARPFTTNGTRKMHYYTLASKVRDTRELWAWLAIEAKVPPLQRVEITATPLHKDKRSPQDPGACAPHVKAAVDGLRDAGVLVDDSPEFVRGIMCRPPRVCGVNGLELVIREVS